MALNNSIDDSVNESDCFWLPQMLKNITGRVQVKLLCGGDLLESFDVPGLWADEDVSVI